MVREYTPIVDGFQIRDITYISALNKHPENPKRFDIVKWKERVIEMILGFCEMMKPVLKNSY